MPNTLFLLGSLLVVLLGESQISQELGVHLKEEKSTTVRTCRTGVVQNSSTYSLQRLSRVALSLLDAVGVGLDAGVSAGVVLLLWIGKQN